MAPSSSGLGHRLLKAKTPVRLRLGLLVRPVIRLDARSNDRAIPLGATKTMTPQKVTMIWIVILLAVIFTAYFFLFHFQYINYLYIKIGYMKQDYSNYCYFNCFEKGFIEYGSCVIENECQRANHTRLPRFFCVSAACRVPYTLDLPASTYGTSSNGRM